MYSDNTKYIERLDHLRFYAAAIVLVYHVLHIYVGETLSPRNPLVTLIYEGHTGVSLFMVLSGFIFSVISYEKEINYRSFIFNRFVRIYPLYTFAIFFSAYVSRTSYTFLDLLRFPYIEAPSCLFVIVRRIFWQAACLPASISCRLPCTHTC